MTKFTPKTTLFSTTAIVGLSTALLPSVTGYGTILFQIVVLNAWGIVARNTSGKFADQHHAPVWVVALILNLILYLIPATGIWLGLRNRKSLLCMIAIAGWCLFYLSCLFVLFPATDGP